MEKIKLLYELCHELLFVQVRFEDDMSYYNETILALRELAQAVIEFEGDWDELWTIGEFGCASLDNLLIGAYWFATDYHSGQWSPEYALLCAIGETYSPGRCCCGPEKDSAEQETYEALLYKSLESLLKGE